jgi:DNA-binding PadR family transcriptional regulator
MASANRTAYAILGLLAQGPKTGYEIKQVVEQTISHFWKESYGHIYPTLNHLIAEGQVTRGAETGLTGNRQRYLITAAGEETLKAWLAVPVEMEGTRNELALKLYFGHLVAPAVSHAHLAAHREQNQRMLARFREAQPDLEQQLAAGAPEALYHMMTLSLGLHIAQARVAWCDAALQLLAATAHDDPDA